MEKEQLMWGAHFEEMPEPLATSKKEKLGGKATGVTIAQTCSSDLGA